jgi:hypothetical protein
MAGFNVRLNYFDDLNAEMVTDDDDPVISIGPVIDPGTGLDAGRYNEFS